MRSLFVLLFLFLMISDVSGIDSRLQNDSLARLKAIADAKVNKDERVAIEIFECDSCSYGYNFRGRTETRKFYDSDGFLIAMHFVMEMALLIVSKNFISMNLEMRSGTNIWIKKPDTAKPMEKLGKVKAGSFGALEMPTRVILNWMTQLIN
ncbi:MAG: hypothetical protein IPH33_14330 [Bacteroidetes bacterium]|nr:hypothetical protein [Bacteroidota bacterium]